MTRIRHTPVRPLPLPTTPWPPPPAPLPLPWRERRRNGACRQGSGSIRRPLGLAMRMTVPQRRSLPPSVPRRDLRRDASGQAREDLRTRPVVPPSSLLRDTVALPMIRRPRVRRVWSARVRRVRDRFADPPPRSCLRRALLRGQPGHARRMSVNEARDIVRAEATSRRHPVLLIQRRFGDARDVSTCRAETGSAHAARRTAFLVAHGHGGTTGAMWAQVAACAECADGEGA